jgi:hypothetical protein
VVQGFRSSTGLGIQGSTVVLGYCRASRVIQQYTGTGVVLGVVLGVVQLYSTSTRWQVSRCDKGVQE